MALKSVNLTRAELLSAEQRKTLGLTVASGLVVIETRNPDLKIVGSPATNYTQYMQRLAPYVEDAKWAVDGGKN